MTQPQPTTDDLREALCEIDRMMGRLHAKRHTATDTWLSPTRTAAADHGETAILQKITHLCTNTAETDQIAIAGGVFSHTTDPLWMLSQGDDVSVSVRAPAASGGCQRLMDGVGEVKRAIQGAVCPVSATGDIVPCSWLPGELTVVAKRDLARGELIAEYHGYFLDQSEPSNEHYNATVGGSRGMTTVDPTCGDIEGPNTVCSEFAHSIACRINEPPPHSTTATAAGGVNCSWKIRRHRAPEVYAARDIVRGKELFLGYGGGFADERRYPVAEGCRWLQTEDSYESD
ncbi:unnamed protein product [Vitrella brassicaformis CCMP3155]|uniref:SET domain-containing protein n=2 Tax=Vitrella brassicaformis TaxID=1169539 RepID=A0A0G4FDW8_VITBC|nr:unnamed protein product [Vitrella brassicaformis CCMP3155]|mmetsp:Transcript_7901/g.22413  ORF Transcript_7901/g.22413 Transcript_7901/m.22413 type:complete len:287 (-) Transcript_7901:1800-2660(-)|eukprot:CEM11368.1 unnamed protein product [Vitrella brassicaformis CCMP3155]